MDTFKALRMRIKSCKSQPASIPRLISEVQHLKDTVQDALNGHPYKTELYQVLTALGFLHMVKGVSGFQDDWTWWADTMCTQTAIMGPGLAQGC
jgi:hypothetical protein